MIEFLLLLLLANYDDLKFYFLMSRNIYNQHLKKLMVLLRILESISKTEVNITKLTFLTLEKFPSKKKELKKAEI